MPVSARTNVKTFQSQLVASLATVVHALSMIHLDILATPPPAPRNLKVCSSYRVRESSNFLRPLYMDSRTPPFPYIDVKKGNEWGWDWPILQRRTSHVFLRSGGKRDSTPTQDQHRRTACEIDSRLYVNRNHMPDQTHEMLWHLMRAKGE